MLSCSERPSFLPPDLILEPISRRPTILPEATVRAVHDLPAGAGRAAGAPTPGPFDPSARTSIPRVSIVVVTRDNLVFSKLCLESVLANTDYPHYELIVVDNGSGEELLSYLDQLTDRFPFIRVVRNETNRGFAAANNQGLALATGDRFVLLNNDTIVPHGWLTRLVRHLDDPQVGAVGPVTNRIGNEAQIETSYRTYAEFERFAREYTHGHAGERFEIPMLVMFCFAMRRETHERVGPLDEQYHIGMFEDDDYAVRLRSEGYRLVCAEDVFVHHFGGASLGSLLTSGQFQELLKANRERFRRKWGIDWQPHRHRPGPAYRRLDRRDQGGRPEGHPRRCEGARHQQGRSRLARSGGEGRPALPAGRGWLLCRLPSGRERRRDRPPEVVATSRGRISPHPRPGALVARALCRFRGVPRRVRRGGVPRGRSVRDLPPVAAPTRRLIIDFIEFNIS